MKKNLKGRVALIVAVLLVCIYGIIGIPSGLSGKALLEAIRRVTATITLGHPLDPGTQMGALIDRSHMQRVLGFIDDMPSVLAATDVDGRHPLLKVAQKQGAVVERKVGGGRLRDLDLSGAAKSFW